MQKGITETLAKQTQNSYDKMAKEFSDSRSRFWEELAFLAEHIERDDHVLDIGCGNGRFAPLVTSRHAHYDGIDYSAGLIAEARRKFPEQTFQEGDATLLPFSDNCFDIAFSFAVIHHLPSTKERTQFVREALRVLHPGGKLIITAWDLWTMRHIGTLLRSALHTIIRLRPLVVGDVILTFGKQKHPRYVHAFTLHELRTLFAAGGFDIVDVDTIARESGEQNIVLIAQKPL